MGKICKTVTACLAAILVIASCSTDRAKPAPAQEGQKAPHALPVQSQDTCGVERSDDRQFFQNTDGSVCKRYVRKDTASEVKANGVTLFIDSGSVGRDIEISVDRISQESTGDIPFNMDNLTADGAVYRMLPDGLLFDRDITIAMRYDSAALPYGYTPDDIYTYFYNDQTRQWQQVERDSVDARDQIVYSRTNHFTDYINGVLKVPENSDAMAYTPTSIKDLKAADPMEGITLIAPPEANGQGTASLTYPLTIPAGRHGMQPRLAVSYSSAGGSSTLGLGWSLPISEISVETRWGVPRYDASYETESYLLDGTTLVIAKRNDNGNLHLEDPAYHRGYDSRDTTDTLQFFPRVEGEFRKIERIGHSPQTYHWVVTDKDGTRHFYGRTSSSRLTDNLGNIAKWMLEKSVDTYGNTVTYHYEAKESPQLDYMRGSQLCVSNIHYAGHESTADTGQYAIRFHYDEKRDKTHSFRYGTEETDCYLLEHINVTYRDTLIRSYYFGYKEGAFGKTLLCKIFEGYGGLDANHAEFDDVYMRCGLKQFNLEGILHIFHSFDYYGLDSADLFGEPQELENEGTGQTILFSYLDSVLREASIFGGSGSLGWNVVGSMDVGSDYIPALKTFSAGGQFSLNEDYTDGFAQLVDLNGDGYPDKLYKTSSGELKYRPQIPGQNRFGSLGTITGDATSFLHSASKTSNWGPETSIAEGIGAGINKSDNTTVTDVYLSDVNADGLTDIINNGRVLINQGDFSFRDKTDNDYDTLYVGGTCGNEVLDMSGEVDTTLFDNQTYVVERLQCDTLYRKVSDTIYHADGSYETTSKTISYDSCRIVTDTFTYHYPVPYEPNVDLVRMWKAPYTGVVRISGSVQLDTTLDGYRAATRTTDGVRVSIQRAQDTFNLDTLLVLPHSRYSMTIDSVPISEGDTLFFRINAQKKRLYDRVAWNPRIAYIELDSAYSFHDMSLTATDANHDSAFVFSYADDYMLCGRQPVSISPEDTLSPRCRNDFSVACRIRARTPLTQGMVLQWLQSPLADLAHPDSIVGSTSFASGTQPDTVLYWTVDSVPDTCQLSLQLYPLWGGQLNWSDIEADATVTLVHSTDTIINHRLTDAVDTTARKAYIWHTTVDRVYHDYLKCPAVPFPGRHGSATFDIIITHRDSSRYTGPFHFQFRNRANNVCYRQDIAITNDTGHVSTTPFSFSGLDSYWAEGWIDSPNEARAIHDIKIRFSQPGREYRVGLYAKHAADDTKHHGTLYRGWGQFGYKPDSTSDYIRRKQNVPYAFYTDTSQIPHPSRQDLDVFGDTTLTMGFTPEDNLSSNLFNPLSGSWFEMRPDAVNGRWLSYGNIVACSRNTASLDNDNPNEENGEALGVDVFQSPLPAVAPGTKVKAVKRMVVSAGTGTTILGFSHSNGISDMVGDYMDMNGDRYPDIVSATGIQYSKAQGGLGSSTRYYSTGAGTHKSGNSSSGMTFNGTFINAIAEPRNQPRNGRVATSVSGLSQLPASVSGNVSHDTTRNTFMDINGDGLPDIVFNDGRVCYNMGYMFTAARNIPLTGIRYSSSSATAGGYGFNVANSSYSGGISINISSNATQAALMDFNGDGLPDRVCNGIVYFNQVDHFSSPFCTHARFMDGGYAVAFGLSASVTCGIAFPVFGVPVKIGAKLGGGATASYSHSRSEYIDMDNDGNLDYVYLSDRGNIMVRYSTIGRANLLKSVSNFANGVYEVDYRLSPGSRQCPQRHWDMSQLIISDGHSGDGADTLYRRFAYGNRIYNHYEREDYGYDTVITIDCLSRANLSNPATTGYRTRTRIFHNDNYYHRSLIRTERVSQGSKFVETDYSYADAELEDGHYLGRDGSIPPWCEGGAWPALQAETTHHSEGTGNVITSRREYAYGAYGNVDTVYDLGDTSIASDDYSVLLTYDLHPDNYIVANVAVLDIPGYRHRSATYTTEGSLDTITTSNTPTVPSVCHYQYDSYGNVSQVTTPALSHPSGSNYWIRYTYDSMTHSLPTRVKNAEGHESSTDYSLLWQKPIRAIGVGGGQTRYSYDRYGRLDTLVAPNEVAGGQPFTIRYDYWYTHERLQRGSLNDDFPFWARTYNYDPSNPGNTINTVTFSDGLGRIVQVKKDVAENGVKVRTVGGTFHYDALGRKTKEFLPVRELLSHPDTIPDTLVSQTFFTETDYDYLDRPVRVTYADSTTSLHSYSISPDTNGILRLLDDVTDQNGYTSRIFTDSRQLNIQVTDAMGNITQFFYDAIGQLSSSVDPENNVTTHTYDLGGRRTDRMHPSAGHTHWDYDAAGNVTMQTQNNGEQITYTYDYNRPIHVGYSERPQNDVWYEYGDSTSGSNASRLVRQQDATGVQLFAYDLMGNVTYNRHTYVQPHSPQTLTLSTQWVYDSWGRIHTILYPDGEVVNYSYDLGGNVCHVEGNKPGVGRSIYIDTILYDHFGQRTYERDGNRVETRYQYSDTTRRLASLANFSHQTGTMLQDNRYRYDPAGNILRIDDAGLNVRWQAYAYDAGNRLVSSTGDWQGNMLGYTTSYDYSPAGRMEKKTVLSQRMSTAHGLYQKDYSNSYTYGSPGNPFAVSLISDQYGGMQTHFTWDSNGNLTQSLCNSHYSERRLCWTEDNRLQGYWGCSDESGGCAACYNYSACGERNFKLTSPQINIMQNALNAMQNPTMAYPTLYASPLITLTRHGYTKHYFEGDRRVCSKIGGGFGNINPASFDNAVQAMAIPYEEQFLAQADGVTRTFSECLGVAPEIVDTYDLYNVLTKKESLRNDPEPAYFYHSDHLGSAAYLTDDSGQVTQTLNYLPYGEDWVEQNLFSPTDTTRLGIYRFNGKEKDYESGYLYYGARYYESELLTGWLSVDPMLDKYPSISPYSYCAWNPVKLVDPDGKWPRKGVNIYTFKTGVGIGLGYGIEASWKYGVATDYKGMTHFYAVSSMHISNQNLFEGSRNPAFVLGFDIGASLGFERNYQHKTFYEARNCFSTEISIGGKGIVGASVGVGEDSYSASIGLGLSINASTEQFVITQSISLSKAEAREVGYKKQWSVNNVSRKIDNNGNFYYEGRVNDTEIHVKCKAVIDKGQLKPDNSWTSDDYLK